MQTLLGRCRLGGSVVIRLGFGYCLSVAVKHHLSLIPTHNVGGYVDTPLGLHRSVFGTRRQSVSIEAETEGMQRMCSIWLRHQCLFHVTLCALMRAQKHLVLCCSDILSEWLLSPGEMCSDLIHNVPLYSLEKTGDHVKIAVKSGATHLSTSLVYF